MKQSSTEWRGAKADGGDLPGLKATLESLQAEVERQQQQVLAVSNQHWEFLRHIGHEIRNPMTAIIGMTDLTLLTDLTEDQRECLATVQNASKTLMRVLNNMQDYARLQAGTLELEWSGFRLRSSLKELLSRLAPQARSKGLELLCRVAADVPDAIVADQRRLAQVVEHLLTNALLYTHRGEVSLDVQLLEDLTKEVKLRFRIRDTGVGMAAEDSARVTSTWSRPRTTDTRTRSGAGLGLPMVVGLVELFGGEFKLQSQIGQGTECEFTATLLKQQAPRDLSAMAQTPSSLAGRRVLIAVSNNTSRRWLTEVCQEAGVNPIVSEPGFAAALACATDASPPVDLALVDESMLDSADSVEERRAMLAALPVPKILLQWSAMETSNADWTRGNVLSTVTKPWFGDDVQHALQEAFGRIQDAGKHVAGNSNAPQEDRFEMHCEPQEAIARLGGDEELYADVVRRFRDDGPNVLQQLQQHFEAGDADQLHRIAHSFKGLAAMCGAVPVTHAASEIERVGKLGDLTHVGVLLEKLSEAIQQAQTELAQYC